MIDSFKENESASSAPPGWGSGRNWRNWRGHCIWNCRHLNKKLTGRKRQAKRKQLLLFCLQCSLLFHLCFLVGTLLFQTPDNAVASFSFSVLLCLELMKEMLEEQLEIDAELQRSKLVDGPSSSFSPLPWALSATPASVSDSLPVSNSTDPSLQASASSPAAPASASSAVQSHSVASSSSASSFSTLTNSSLCSFWLQGRCKYGSSCRFSHCSRTLPPDSTLITCCIWFNFDNLLHLLARHFKHLTCASAC